MGWPWPFASTAPAKGSETPAIPTPPPQNAHHEGARTKAEMERYQLDVMLLERENLRRLIELRQQEEARHAGPAPGTPSLAQPLPQSSAPPETPPAPQDSFRRSAKQMGLFLAGTAFLTASALISRRAVARKMVDAYPKFYQPSHHGPRAPPRASAEKGEDQLVAVEALGLATLNVFSFGVMMTGGLMFAFDISNVEDLRRKARSKIYGPNGVVDEAADQQIEEWIADILSRRDKKDDDARLPNKNA